MVDMSEQVDRVIKRLAQYGIVEGDRYKNMLDALEACVDAVESQLAAVKAERDELKQYKEYHEFAEKQIEAVTKKPITTLGALAKELSAIAAERDALQQAVNKVLTPKRFYQVLRPACSWHVNADKGHWRREAKLIRAAIDAAKTAELPPKAESQQEINS